MTVKAAFEANWVDLEKSLPIAEQPSVLTGIYQPKSNIAVWQRSLSVDLTQSIQEMLQGGLHLALVKSVTPHNAAELIRDKLSGYACADALGQDVAMLVDMFCCLFDLREAGLRLTSLDNAMCPKFHVDQVPCRLVTTYVGSATQWVENDHVDRCKLGVNSAGQLDHLSGLLKTDTAINQMEQGDVALLKGTGWEGNEQTGLVHRSPEITACNRRLLLTLDLM
ncbi:DUF1826 domain-containing protein [Aliivibrio kagoshimensis]|uniref:DUF1826 domain-containing protein n=1 Tax=Aliivibrio kagoshimensis TaxID=2910230 RepID=UPI003D09E912